MSLSGRNSIQLQEERREQLRLTQVRSDTEALLASCENTVASVKDAALQQLVAKDLQAIDKELDRVRESYREKPDQSLKTAKSIQRRLHQVIANAQAGAHAWSKQQAEAVARIESARTRLMAAAPNAAGEHSRQASMAIGRATMQFQEDRFEDVTAACDEAERFLEEASTAKLNEDIRLETVKGLLHTLSSMGFVVETPQRRDAANVEGGVVTLTGKLPSGRLARFDVQVDGTMRYEFDGYEDRACGKDLQKIESVLKDRCSIKLGPPQITWKNPIRNYRSAKTLPTSARTRRH